MIDLTFEYDLEHPCILMPLPCGCVIDSAVKVHDGIVLCPWCEATFLSEEFGEWINSDSPPPIFMADGPRSIIRCPDGLLHEVHGEHDGLPVVKMGDAYISFTQFERVDN